MHLRGAVFADSRKADVDKRDRQASRTRNDILNTATEDVETEESAYGEVMMVPHSRHVGFVYRALEPCVYFLYPALPQHMYLYMFPYEGRL